MRPMVSLRGKREAVEKLIASPLDRRLVNAAFQRILDESFREDARATEARGGLVQFATRDEFKRRADILYDWLSVMRGDLHWSLQRAFDHLPFALRATLDGKDWTPPAQDRSWGVR